MPNFTLVILNVVKNPFPVANGDTTIVHFALCIKKHLLFSHKGAIIQTIYRIYYEREERPLLSFYMTEVKK